VPSVQVRHEGIAIYNGPLPPPEVLVRYNQAVPDAAERILRMAEQQAANRREIELRSIRSQCRDSLLGLVSAFLIGMSSLACSTIVTWQGHPVSGTILGGTGLAAIIAAFVYGTRTRKSQ
jgi:uncharacterized membrane protein